VTFIYRFLIKLYQRHLSPRKGYRCAYSLEHGGTGCSGAVLNILEEKGALRGWSDIKLRFARCTDAADEQKKRKKQREKKKPDSAADCGCDIAEAVGDIASCRSKGGSKCDLPDCGSFDCVSLNAGGCKNCGFANIFRFVVKR
jgi:putative component of membrane protein insertase Oxa1/YidC/SpoIIIJ protein YidD